MSQPLPSTAPPWFPPFLWILGPCVVETRDTTLRIAAELKGIAERHALKLVFKASFDKANRSSIASRRGAGIEEGLKILAEVKRDFALPVTTDVHEPWQCGMVADVVDLVQIPAMLSRQTDLLLAAARTGLPVNVKRMPQMPPQNLLGVVEKIDQGGGVWPMVTDRGTAFGYGMLVADFQNIREIRNVLACPVLWDATHSTQSSPLLRQHSDGSGEQAKVLARCAVAAGADGLFLETHYAPEEAWSDGPCMVPLDEIEALVVTCLRVREAVT